MTYEGDVGGQGGIPSGWRQSAGRTAETECDALVTTLSIRLDIDVYKRSLMTQLTISEARKALLDLPEKLARTSERAVTITRRGQPVLAI